MLKSEFDTLFYPQDGVTVRPSSASRTLPLAVLVPHAAVSSIDEELQQAYSTVAKTNPKLIIVLSSLHMENLMSDSDKFLFIPEDDEGIVVAGKIVPFDLSGLVGKEGVARRDSYFKEDASIEMQLPFIAALFPSVPVLPVFVSESLKAKECKLLASYLATLTDKRQTLLVVSANATGRVTVQEGKQQAQAFVSALEAGEPLLDKKNKGIVSSCGCGIIDAVSRLRWVNKKWDILSISHGTWRGKNLDDEMESAGQGAMVYHLSAIAQGGR